MTDSTPRVITPALRAARTLTIVYVGLSVLTVIALGVLTAVAPEVVSIPAWVRAAIVAGLSFLTLSFAMRAVRGRPKALLRLRIVSIVLVVAVAGVLFFLPLPIWMVIEQAACGLVLLAVAILAFRAREG